MMNPEKIFSILQDIEWDESHGDSAEIRESIALNHTGNIKVLMRNLLVSLEECWTLIDKEQNKKSIEADNNLIEEELDTCAWLINRLEALYTIKKYIDACQS